MHTLPSPDRAPTRPSALVLKFGGELVDDPSGLQLIVSAIGAFGPSSSRPLVIVHGGGREVDAALATAGVAPQRVDGLRITDEATLEVVVAVLAGSVNTRLVAALASGGVPAVGLTGADGQCGLSEAAPPHQTLDGRAVSLGRVGLPIDDADVRVLWTLVEAGFVPVVASIGIGSDGRLFNVNGDTFAAHLASRLQARRLVIAGTTSGIVDTSGATIDRVDAAGIDDLVKSGTATAGMIAKLRACRQALTAGVGDVVIVNGRKRDALESAMAGGELTHATRLIGTPDLTASAPADRLG
jgi:acetylglutamate kinase